MTLVKDVEESLQQTSCKERILQLVEFSQFIFKNHQASALSIFSTSKLTVSDHMFTHTMGLFINNVLPLFAAQLSVGHSCQFKRKFGAKNLFAVSSR